MTTPKTIVLDRAIITLIRTEIQCPACQHTQDVADLLSKPIPKRNYWLRSCENAECQIKLGVIFDMRGDAQCWDEAKEVELEKNRPKEPEPTQEEIDAFIASIPPYDEAAEQQSIATLISDIKNENRVQQR